MKAKTICRSLGIAAVSFGIGILFSSFLPESILVVMEALLIATVGFFYFWQK